MRASSIGTVLVVEDDPDMRDIAAEMLVFTGFRVIEAVDAQSGLEQFNKNPDIDLVFSDIIMPGGRSGIEMAIEMLAKKTRILLFFSRQVIRLKQRL